MKLACIGAGNVGAMAAQAALSAGVDEIVLVDIIEGVPQGKALDLTQSAAVSGACGHVSGSNDYGDIDGADVVIVTAGLPRKPGMNRDDLIAANSQVITSVSSQIVEHAPESVVIMVTNPLDVMTYVAMRETGFPRERILGMAGVLDTARFNAFVAMELSVSAADVSAIVLGGHGDAMVPLVRLATVGGVPLVELIEAKRLEAIVGRTAAGGGEIVKLLGSASAYYAPGAAAFQMAECVLFGRRRILPASVWAQGEFGISDTFVGLPVELGPNGLERVVEIELNDDELSALRTSAGAVRDAIGKL